MVDSDNVESW